MLEIHMIMGRTYGRKYVLRNRLTGTILPKRFFTIRGADRYRNRVSRNLMKTVNRINSGKF